MFKFIAKIFKKFTKPSRVSDVHTADVVSPESYIGKVVPAIPYDESYKPSLVFMIAITDVDGNVIGYLPPAAEDNGDGTASIKVTNS